MPTPRATPPFGPTMLAVCYARNDCRRRAQNGRRAACHTTPCARSRDECISAAIAKQEAIGLRAATDGEYRRAYWHYDFVAGLDGVEIYEPEQKSSFRAMFHSVINCG